MTNQFTRESAGTPVSPDLIRRKNAANALLRRRKVACCELNDQRP
nr:hypothetical protein [Streptomyces sp. AC512_CC834]